MWKYYVEMTVGYRDVIFKFDNGDEAISFASTILSHNVEDDEHQKISIHIEVRREEPEDNKKED